MVTQFKSLKTGSIAAAGAYKELTWTPDRDIIITRVMMIERSDTQVNVAPVDAYIAIAGVPYTRDYVPAAAIGSTPQYCWQPNLAVSKGSEIYVKITNNRGATAVDVNLVIEYQ